MEMPATVRTTQASDEYWFPARRYGWGWGLPARWQGWVVLVAFFALLSAISATFPPATQMGNYLVAMSGLCAALIAVCWRKGEPPRWRWRWGDRKPGDANNDDNHNVRSEKNERPLK